jgi:chromosome segregation ATPase
MNNSITVALITTGPPTVAALLAYLNARAVRRNGFAHQLAELTAASRRNEATLGRLERAISQLREQVSELRERVANIEGRLINRLPRRMTP